MRHKRSGARLISFPFPNSSTTMMMDSETNHTTLPQPNSLQGKDERDISPSQGDLPRSRFSGESPAPTDGYSELFTSGLLRHQRLQARHLQPPKTPSTPSKQSHLTPTPAPYLLNPNHLPHTPRRRSSIIHTTPGSVSPQKFKSNGGETGVERALEGVMRSLKLGTITPRRGSNKQTPPSKFSDDSEPESETPPRKSLESVRSRFTIRSTKSNRSLRKEREKEKEKEKDSRMDRIVIVENVPPMPTMHENVDGLIPMSTAHTPKKTRRVVDGLVRKLGLTPKKTRVATSPLPTPAPAYPLPMLPDPTQPGAESTQLQSTLPQSNPPQSNIAQSSLPQSTIPRKGSFSTLRSVTKKGSATTLRSLRSLAQQLNNNGSTTTLVGDHPPLPTSCKWREENAANGFGEGCFPTTPKSGRRTPKSSIGPPHLQPSVSPSTFLREMPRRAPQTPKQEQQAASLESENGRISVTPPVPARTSSDSMDLDDVEKKDTLNTASLSTDSLGLHGNVDDTDLIDRIDAVIAMEETLAFGGSTNFMDSNFSGLGGDVRTGFGGTGVTHTPAYTSRFQSSASPFTPELDHSPASQPSCKGPRPSFDSAFSPDAESLMTPSSRPSTDESFGTFSPWDQYKADRDGAPFSLRAVSAALDDQATKSRRLLTLFPKNNGLGGSRENVRLGMQTPPAAVLRGAKGSMGPGGGGLIAFKSKEDLNTSYSTNQQNENKVIMTPSPSPYTRLLQVHSSSQSQLRRGPLGILPLNTLSKDNFDNDDTIMPFRGGAGDGWSTPVPPGVNMKPNLRSNPLNLSQGSNKLNNSMASIQTSSTHWTHFSSLPGYDNKEHPYSKSKHSTNPSIHTFGRRAGSAAGSHRSRPSVPDFTRTPPGSPGSNTVETEEWELEAYLNKVEG